MPSSRKRGSRKTARKYYRKPSHKGTVRRPSFRGSVAGKIMPPLDVRSKSQLKEFVKRIEKGPVTFIMVWAPWCPHCHTMMPHFDAASKSSNRSVQSIKVQDNMLPLVNEVLTQRVNKSVKPLNVEGFPSIIVVDKKGNAVTDVEPIRNTAVMTKIMNEAGPLAEDAGINKNEGSAVVKANSIMKNNIKNIAENKPIVENNQNKNKKLLSNIGVEEVGLAASKPSKNIDIGEEEFVESVGPIGNNSKNNSKKNSYKLNAIPLNNMANAGTGTNSNINSKEDLEDSIAPSSLNTFSGNNTKVNVTAPNADIKKEAEEIISMASPLSPPNAMTDVETESISNALTPEQKVSGGARKANGGSLYYAMARTAYTLAPAAALLATAAMVMKNKKGIKDTKTRKHSKKTRASQKTQRRR
jgi:thiol-disulfide isomerase/thioredoxin